MNLHDTVAGTVAAVNPRLMAQLQLSTGSAQDSNFKPTPSYAAPVNVMAQMQPLTYKDMQQLDGVNLGGQGRALYLSGNVQGVVRADNRGGDLVALPDGTQWLVVQVLEDFFLTSGWVKVAAKRQQAAA